MKSYFCYIHTLSSMTPHIRVMNVDDRAQLVEALRGVVHEWPDYEVVDVYDERDQLVVQVTSGDDMVLH